ncbi:hypothetical protein [Brevibacillus dissolubilis]|uniref:hypothetical protein n=1 Tax=Brevibacillus dissolubilis TaxID=1844116 RepID=UPI0011164012|nr:hypothetical protein [Brevibacillus dissolubilis]
MISTDQLMGYLPVYYQESRQIRAIMDVVSAQMPDVDADLWKTFFVSLLSDKSIDLWREEFGVESDEELVARLRSSGTMNLETLQAQGIRIDETYRSMPEEGVILSASGVMADGREFMPLTTLIYTTPETLLMAKGLVRLMGLAGFRYLFALLIQEKLEVERRPATDTRTVLTGIVLPAKTHEELSGRQVIRQTNDTYYLLQRHTNRRNPWWSPNLFFTDALTYEDESLTIQQSTIQSHPTDGGV